MLLVRSFGLLCRPDRESFSAFRSSESVLLVFGFSGAVVSTQGWSESLARFPATSCCAYGRLWLVLVRTLRDVTGHISLSFL